MAAALLQMGDAGLALLHDAGARQVHDVVPDLPAVSPYRRDHAGRAHVVEVLLVSTWRPRPRVTTPRICASYY